MPDISMPKATRAHGEKRHALAPAANDAFRAFGKAVFAPGALDVRTKQLIAVAVAHVTQCPWCIEAHVKAAVALPLNPAHGALGSVCCP